MQCARCHAENRDGLKFCEDCGARLAVICSPCGAEITPGKRFCGSCGAPVAAPTAIRFAAPEAYTPKHLAERILTSKSALEGERKQVTVLLADLKGSMELLADRDPEEARRLLDPVLERMMDAVHRYEGTVNQVMGDGIMALFGAPLAHEDHAVRACYAALRMQESVKRYADEIHRTEGIPIQIRVGLNSGEESVRTLAETNVLMGERSAYHVARASQSFQIPATAQAILTARIDRLAPEDKRLRQAAAVIGRDVPFTLLQAIGEEPEEVLRRGLSTLQAAEFLYESRLFPDLEYTFRHALTQQVAYESLLGARRRALHTATAQALEALYAERLDQAYDRLAYHYSRTDNAPKAVEYLTRFAEKAASMYAHAEAVTALEEALVHAERLPIEERDRRLLEVVLRRVESLHFLGRRQEIVDVLLQHRDRLEPE